MASQKIDDIQSKLIDDSLALKTLLEKSQNDLQTKEQQLSLLNE